MEPKIRLKGFSGDWKCSNVGSECDVLTGFPFDGADICLSGDYMLMRGINITEGVLRHSDDIDRYYTGDLSSLMKYRLRLNDLVISMDGSKVGKNSALVTSKEVDSLLVQRVARLRSDEINTVKLLFVKISSGAFFDYVQKKKTASAIPHISPSDIKNFPISLPVSNEERSSLSNYFTHLDTLISSTSRRLEKLRAVKAASLQSMFPQEGEKEPRVRFKGFSGEWTSQFASEVFSPIKNNSLSRADLSASGEVMNIHYGDILIKFGECVSPNIDGVPYVRDNSIGQSLLEKCALKNGDVIFADAAEDNTVGKCTELVANKEDKVVSGLHTIACRPSFRFADKYLGYHLNSPVFHDQLLPYIQGSKISSISRKVINNTIIRFPSLPEQTAIANYFTHLDDLIQSTSRRLDKLRAVKAACLEGMFV